jgi:hypothetical protein
LTQGFNCENIRKIQNKGFPLCVLNVQYFRVFVGNRLAFAKGKINKIPGFSAGTAPVA